jgi:hypothetical protein
MKLWGKRPGVLFCVLVMVVLAGCAASGHLFAQIRDGMQTWYRQGITSYRIDVVHVRSSWHYERHTITIRDGQLVGESASCATEPMEIAVGQECAVEPFDPADYTVIGLFVTAQSLAEAHPKNGVEIKFDSTFGFPSRIFYDLPDVVDDDELWEVISFEVLE